MILLANQNEMTYLDDAVTLFPKVKDVHGPKKSWHFQGPFSGSNYRALLETIDERAQRQPDAPLYLCSVAELLMFQAVTGKLQEGLFASREFAVYFKHPEHGIVMGIADDSGAPYLGLEQEVKKTQESWPGHLHSMPVDVRDARFMVGAASRRIAPITNQQTIVLNPMESQKNPIIRALLGDRQFVMDSISPLELELVPRAAVSDDEVWIAPIFLRRQSGILKMYLKRPDECKEIKAYTILERQAYGDPNRL